MATQPHRTSYDRGLSRVLRLETGWVRCRRHDRQPVRHRHELAAAQGHNRIVDASRTGEHDDVKAQRSRSSGFTRAPDPGRRRRRLTERPLRMRARCRRGLYPANCG